MRDLLATLDTWRAEGTGAGRAVVVRTFGSAPRPEGAVLLVADDGRLMGSVSGGCVEGAAAEEIETSRRTASTIAGSSNLGSWDRIATASLGPTSRVAKASSGQATTIRSASGNRSRVAKAALPSTTTVS